MRSLMIANWKMKPATWSEALKIFTAIQKSSKRIRKSEVVICPAYPHLARLKEKYKGKKIKFGAQDSFWQNVGSYTGEVSPAQISDMGIEYVILGHSERRALGETNEMVSLKVREAIKNKLRVILCVGEAKRDLAGGYLAFIEEEIRESLSKINKKDLAKIIVAYEPIWAIGKDESEAVSPREIHQTKLFILKILNNVFGAEALKTKVIYGGATGPENTKSIIEDGEMDGLLVGHESLVPASFSEMLSIVEKI